MPLNPEVVNRSLIVIEGCGLREHNNFSVFMRTRSEQAKDEQKKETTVFLRIYVPLTISNNMLKF